jgi:riboflavin synthase
LFTGLVEEVGVVEAVTPLEGGREISIRGREVLSGMALGDSIAIDGACHNVTAFDATRFVVQSVATTLERTTIGEFAPGRRVNLERPLALGDRLGGHLVQGHVDGVGRILRIEHAAEHWKIDFTLPAVVAQVTILHGSITMNGVSLTVNALPEPGVCQVSIIPHTWEVTALADLTSGAAVNLEGDMIGKYVRHLLGTPGEPSEHGGGGEHLARRWGY